MAQKILVIDDDLFIRELYEEVLKNAGYEVDSAVNGEEGLKKLQAGGYALTLLDFMMPKLDGLGVLTALNENPPHEKNGPIILLTNMSSDSDSEKGIQNGAFSYFVKSDLTPDQLLEKVQNILSS